MDNGQQTKGGFMAVAEEALGQVSSAIPTSVQMLCQSAGGSPIVYISYSIKYSKLCLF